MPGSARALYDAVLSCDQKPAITRSLESTPCEKSLAAGRGRDDYDFFVGEGEHPVAVGGDADEFRAGAAAGQLGHLRRLARDYFFVVSGLGARDRFFGELAFRFLGALLHHFRSGRDFLFDWGRGYFFLAFRGRRGLGASDFG